MFEQVKKTMKSKSGETCIGPCYKANVVFVHPYTFQSLNEDEPFCPIEPKIIFDKKTGKNITIYADKCNKVTADKYEINNELLSSIIVPNIDFNSKQFLKLFYDINSFDDAANALLNKSLPLYTRLIIADNTFNSFSKEFIHSDLIDERILKFYQEVIKKMWIMELYNIIAPYLVIRNDKIYLEKTPVKNKNNKIEKINYFIKEYASLNMINKYLIQFVKEYKSKIEIMTTYNLFFKKSIADQLKKVYL